MTAHPRAQPEPEPDSEPARPSPYGIATTVAGIVAVLAGAVVLWSAILPQLVPTFGPVPLSFREPAPGSLTEAAGTGALYFGTLILPAGGFSMAYLSARHDLRRLIAGACVVFFGLQLALLIAALLWITGTGMRASALVDADRDDSTFVLTSPIALLLGLAAAAIMYSLATRTDFDRKSAGYFARGSAVVRVRPLPLVLHALWILAAAAVWAVIVYLPVLAGAPASEASGALSWPADVGGDFTTARAAYSVVAGIVVGALVSSLVKKLLYLTVLRGLVLRPVDGATQSRWRALQPFTHYPIAIAGGTLTACVLFLVPVGRDGDGPDTAAITVFALISAVALATGFAFLASVWKTGDDPLLDAPLQQAVAGDIRASFATPSSRKRKSKRNRR